MRRLKLLFVVLLYMKCATSQDISDIPTDILENLNIDPLILLPLLGQANYNSLLMNNLCSNATLRNNTLPDDNLCLKQLEVVCNSEVFLSKMVDAASKFPYAGMLVETKLDLGNFDECIELDMTEKGLKIIGKYCAAAVLIPTTPLNASNVIEEAYKLSICIPNHCTSKDISMLLSMDPDVSLINDRFCTTKDTWKIMKPGDYPIIVFVILFLLFLFAATIYDIYCGYKEQDNNYLLLKAFSFYSNGKRLFKISKNATDQIVVINGLKVISMMWIIGGHHFSMMYVVPSTKADIINQMEWTWRSFYITTAHLAVDTFFYISGFLLAYQYLKQKCKPLKEHLINLPMLFLHRYLRLTPAVAVIFLLLMGVYQHLGTGPLYNMYLETEQENCRHYWWSYFLYTQNYVNYNEVCLLHTWYLSADFQLFFISPIICIPVAILIKKRFKLVMLLLIILNILFTIGPFTLQLVLGNFDNLYDSHSRLNVYFTGFMVGAFMREKSHWKYKFSRRLNVGIWAGILLMMFGTLLSYKEMQLLIHNNDPSFMASFIFLRGFWGIGLSWIIYSCHNGHGGIITKILTLKPFQLLNRLTFCMYLTHAFPISYTVFRLRTKLVLTEGVILLSALIALVTTTKKVLDYSNMVKTLFPRSKEQTKNGETYHMVGYFVDRIFHFIYLDCCIIVLILTFGDARNKTPILVYIHQNYYSVYNVALLMHLIWDITGSIALITMCQSALVTIIYPLIQLDLFINHMKANRKLNLGTISKWPTLLWSEKYQKVQGLLLAILLIGNIIPIVIFLYNGGQIMEDQYEEIHNTLLDMSWYAWSNENLKTYLMILTETYKPIRTYFSINAVLNREATLPVNS
ncbi:nose resistant to fluoxetine protein 6-like [Sitophilus oryzae]|uniref:Nose resistant to fluoxetine protein 6-like n=1 Tax=Sitophilus oryzae TaxID=7048 RepID=A0A6J2X4Q7_SITOR|nr:nose resistant to fluoxetine protein 6-like [Sitophilus oryzae]